MVFKCLITTLAVMTCAFTVLAEDMPIASRYNLAKFEDRGYFETLKRRTESKVKVKETYEYYDIEGKSASELKRQMKQKGTKWHDGKVYAALTTWDIRYDYDISYADGKYRISSVSTNVGIDFNFPRLSEGVVLPDDLKGSWNSYMENLTKHELGHRDIAVGIAEEIYHTLASLDPCASKSELESEAQRLIKIKLKKLKQDQIDYDHDTCHGETQGAVLM